MRLFNWISFMFFLCSNMSLVFLVVAWVLLFYSGGGGSQRVRLRQSGQLRSTPRREVVAGVDDARAWPLRQST